MRRKLIQTAIVLFWLAGLPAGLMLIGWALSQAGASTEQVKKGLSGIALFWGLLWTAMLVIWLPLRRYFIED